MLTLRITPLPNHTSPDTVKWSNSMQFGMLPNRFRHSCTFKIGQHHIFKHSPERKSVFSMLYNYRYITLVKPLPNLIRGTDGNDLAVFISSRPFFCVNKLLMMSTKSLVVFTGKKRLRGTFMPRAPLKFLIAAPDAVSSWITFMPVSKVYW